jgi:hypothetical protein
MSSGEKQPEMNCVNRLHYLGGPKEDDGSCLAKAINAFLGFPFIIPCSSDETLVYCYWAHLMNHVLVDNKELLGRVLSRHGDAKSMALLSLLEKNDYFIQSPEIQQKKRAETPSAQIQMIIDSGFTADRAMYAMNFVNNDIGAAFNWLFEHPDEEIPPFKPNCGHEFTTIPLHADFSSISEGIFLAMMLSPIADPCIPLGQTREILSLKIISLGEFMDDVSGEAPTYDGNFGAIVLNACKRIQKNFEIKKFPHSFCIKYNSQHPQYPKKYFYIYDALEDINRFDIEVKSSVPKYMPCMDIRYEDVPKHERMPLWQRETIVIVKEIVPEGDKVFTNGYTEGQLKKPELEKLFNMYHFVNWETSASEHCHK